MVLTLAGNRPPTKRRFTHDLPTSELVSEGARRGSGLGGSGGRAALPAQYCVFWEV